MILSFFVECAAYKRQGAIFFYPKAKPVFLVNKSLFYEHRPTALCLAVNFCQLWLIFYLFT